MSSVNVYEIVYSLRVPSGVCGYSTNSTRCRGIVMFLMCLYVFTKFNFSVCIEVKLAIENDLSRALSRGDPATKSKHIVPEDLSIDQFNDEYGRHMLE